MERLIEDLCIITAAAALACIGNILIQALAWLVL